MASSYGEVADLPIQAEALSIKITETRFTLDGRTYRYWIVGRCPVCRLIHGETANQPELTWKCQCGKTLKVDFGS